MVQLTKIVVYFYPRKDNCKTNKERISNRSRISENDRLAILIVGKALGCNFNKESEERRMEIIRFAASSDDGCNSLNNNNFCHICLILLHTREIEFISAN